MSNTLHIVGVPEHFNYPFRLALTADEAGFRWTDVPEGSGRMAEMLAQGEADCAIMLTEAAVLAITRGLPARILQYYVGTPLQWGIHLGYRERMPALSELSHYRVAISRKGSGSHLMAALHARSRGWDISTLEYVQVDTLAGARRYLAEHPDCYFLWERYTTQPLVDAGEFIRAGTFPTPWPCFVWVCSMEAWEHGASKIRSVQELVNKLAGGLKFRPDPISELAEYYQLSVPRVSEWLSQTEWSRGIPTAEQMNDVQASLGEIGLVSEKHPYQDLVLSVP